MFPNNKQENRVEQEQKRTGQMAAATMAAVSPALLKIE